MPRSQISTGFVQLDGPVLRRLASIWAESLTARYSGLRFDTHEVAEMFNMGSADVDGVLWLAIATGLGVDREVEWDGRELTARREVLALADQFALELLEDDRLGRHGGPGAGP